MSLNSQNNHVPTRDESTSTRVLIDDDDERPSTTIDFPSGNELERKLAPQLEPPSTDEKAVYKRSSELIDRHASTYSSERREARAPVENTKLASLDMELGQHHNSPEIGSDAIAERARAASVAAFSKTRFFSNRNDERPTAGRGNHKTTNGPQLNIDGSQAPMPGAQFVRTRALGVLPSQFLELYRRERLSQIVRDPITTSTTPVTSPTTVDPLPAPEESAPVTTEKTVANKSFGLAGIAICVIVAAVLSVCFIIQKEHSGSASGNDSTTRFSPFTSDCASVDNQIHPHVLSQCYCHKTISVVPDDIAPRYENLTQSLLRKISPSFNETMDSCSPINQALVWLASGGGETFSSTDESKVNQRYDLAVLFSLWNGLGWIANDGWLSSNSECTWFGIVCNNLGVVESIALSNNHLVGDLKLAVPYLTSLVSLVLNGNSFGGSTIPGEINLLSQLQHLELVSTGVHGTIPHQVFDLNETLRHFNVAENSLVGTIPRLIASLGKLETWNVSHNQLTGVIPAELGRCTGLLKLELEDNDLRGSILSQFGLLTALEVLNANHNNISGMIPTAIGHCTKLTDLNLGRNKVQGTLPSSLGLLTALSYMNLQENVLSGTIPTELGDCTSLIEFQLGDNHFNGSVPSDLAALSKIELFDIHGNDDLSNGAPPEICTGYNDLSRPAFHCYGCRCPITLY